MDLQTNEREKITGEVRIPKETAGFIAAKVRSTRDFTKEFKGLSGRDTSEVIAFLFASALAFDASDVHTEPTKENVHVRFRIDGLLQDVAEISNEEYRVLLSRIKLLSGLKLNVADRPQDGRFSIVFEEKPIEIRAATLPSEYGESVVLRVLNPKNLITVQDLGLRKDLQELFEKEIAKPNGMVVVTGPTGSGKTTTLYAFLNEVAKPDLKVITIEDPIEYHLKGISQTQVNPEKGYDFASGLRAIVRQDPDVILVGEIRDGETADIALQAALTGHLVFSTLHTNDAAGTVSRLTSLGSQLNTIASALTLVIAQRLLRKVCPKCSRLAAASEEQIKIFAKALASVKRALVPAMKNAKIPGAKGCEACNFTGYKGRIGIFEAIQITDKAEDFILQGPSIAGLKKFALDQGMVTMYQDGLLKVLAGLTTIEEVERATAE